MTNSETFSGYGLQCEVTLSANDCPPGPLLPRPSPLPSDDAFPTHADDLQAAMNLIVTMLPARWPAKRPGGGDQLQEDFSWAGESAFVVQVFVSLRCGRLAG